MEREQTADLRLPAWPASRPILGKAACGSVLRDSLTAVSQRRGICSPICERTCWDRGGAGLTSPRAARPRAPRPLRSCSGDSRGPGRPRPSQAPGLCPEWSVPSRPSPLPGSQGNNLGEGSPGRGRQPLWGGQWVAHRSNSHCETLRLPGGHHLAL